MRRRDLRENGVDLGQPLGAKRFACLFAEIKAFGGDAIGKDDLVIVEQKVMIAERRNIIGRGIDYRGAVVGSVSARAHVANTLSRIQPVWVQILFT